MLVWTQDRNRLQWALPVGIEQHEQELPADVYTELVLMTVFNKGCCTPLHGSHNLNSSNTILYVIKHIAKEEDSDM